MISNHPLEHNTTFITLRYVKPTIQLRYFCCSFFASLIAPFYYAFYSVVNQHISLNMKYLILKLENPYS